MVQLQGAGVFHVQILANLLHLAAHELHLIRHPRQDLGAQLSQGRTSVELSSFFECDNRLHIETPKQKNRPSTLNRKP